jgi:acetyl esterase/lipase
VEGVRVARGIAYRDSRSFWGGGSPRLDVYMPDGPAPKGGWPVVVAVHGGGWRGGDRGDFGRSLAPLVRRGAAVVAVGYTLSRPGAPSWPANLDDVSDAVEWVRRQGGDYGLDPDRLTLLGASAGGHLALLLAERPGAKASIRGVVDFYGPADLKSLHAASPAARSVELLLGGPPASRPDLYAAASPVVGARSGMPPVLIVHGAADSLVPLDQSQRLARALAEAGVDYRLVVVPGARHGFGLTAGAFDLTPEVFAFLDAVCGGRASRGGG